MIKEFTTPVELPKQLPPIHHAQRLLLMGSCFAENMGTLLKENGFRVDMNPYGIIYNPLSVAKALREIFSDKVYGQSDLFCFRDSWHSSMHHSSFSSPSEGEVLLRVNNRLKQTRRAIEDGVDWLMLTWGTAYVYEQRSTGCVVSNCHKQPEREFLRRRLSVEEIVGEYTSLLGELKQRCPHLKVLFTVSPIRHIRDGLHANQLSKATLLLAIEQLQASFPEQVFYFPSYEIVLDELRDYRFYADDMLHPSSLAIQYLWKCFTQSFFSIETRTIMDECECIRKALAHRPFRAESEEYKRFLGQIVLKIERLKRKYPYLDGELFCYAYD